MRIKYLGAKVAVILVTVLATPVVWAALAWPEWQSAAPPDFSAETAEAVELAPTQEAPAAVPQVIRQVIVVPRYVVVEAPAASSGPPSPAGTAPPLPTVAPSSVADQPRSNPAPKATQEPAAASGSGSSGATAKQSTSSSSSQSNQASSQSSQSSKSQSTTRGS
jgi:hypothetical protein